DRPGGGFAVRSLSVARHWYVAPAHATTVSRQRANDDARRPPPPATFSNARRNTTPDYLPCRGQGCRTRTAVRRSVQCERSHHIEPHGPVPVQSARKRISSSVISCRCGIPSALSRHVRPC